MKLHSIDEQKVLDFSETLNTGKFEYSTRKTLNRSETEIDQEVLDQIEAGCPIEVINGLDLPIFYYLGQITIHGQFPKLSIDRIGYYKNIFQNQNKSIGIKYGAIDYLKKNTIESAINLSKQSDIKADFKWVIHRRINDFIIYTYELIDNKEQAVETAKKYKNFIDTKLSKDLIIGDYSCGFSKVYGQLYCTLRINLNAIFEQNILPFLKVLTNIDSFEKFEELQNIKREKDAVEDKEREERWAKEAAEELVKNKENFITETKNLKKVNKIDNREVCYLIYNDKYKKQILKTKKGELYHFSPYSDYDFDIEINKKPNALNKKNKITHPKIKERVLALIEKNGIYEIKVF